MTEKPVWCEECGEIPEIVSVGYDGIQLRCDCEGLRDTAFVQIKDIQSAPSKWKYNGPRGEKRFNSRLGF